MQNLIYGSLFFPLCVTSEKEINKETNTPELTATLDQIPLWVFAEIILVLLHLVQAAGTPQVFPESYLPNALQFSSRTPQP